MNRIRRVVGNLGLASVSVALVLGVLELAARWILSSRPPGKSGEQAVYTLFDPVLGWRNKPGAAVKYNRREYQTEVVINSLGFRDIERAVTRLVDRPRILVLGDSFVEGYSVERDETLTRRLEILAAEAKCPMDVVNAGVHGYSTDQEALWYTREGERLRADVVMIAVYYNDIIFLERSNYSGSPKPMVEVHDGVLTPLNTPLSEPPNSRALPSPSAPRPIVGSALKTLLLERLFVGAPRWHARLAKWGLLDAYDPDAVPDELRVYKTRGRLAEVEAAWRRADSILDSLARTIRERGAKPVMVYIPARFEVSPRAMELTLLRYGLDATAWDESRVRTRLGGIAASMGFAFLDLTPALHASISLTRGEPYFPLDGHLNRLGHDTAAQALLPFVRQNGLVECRDIAQ